MFENTRRRIPVSKDDIKKAVKKANDKLKAENKKIESDISDAKKSLKEIEAKASSAEHELKSFRFQSSNVQSSIKSSAVKLDESSRSLEIALKDLSKSKASKNLMEESVSGLLKQEAKSIKAIAAMDKQLEKKVGLKSSISALNKEFNDIKKQLQVRQSEVDILKSDAVSFQASKDSLQAEFEEYKASVDEERESLQLDIERIGALKREKQAQYDLEMSQLDSKIEDQTEDANTFEGLANKSKNEYIAIQSDIILAEKKLQELADKNKESIEKCERSIGKIKERYEAWKLNEFDKVAKLKIKGKIDNIDKAGLKEIFGE